MRLWFFLAFLKISNFKVKNHLTDIYSIVFNPIFFNILTSYNIRHVSSKKGSTTQFLTGIQKIWFIGHKDKYINFIFYFSQRIMPLNISNCTMIASMYFFNIVVIVTANKYTSVTSVMFSRNNCINNCWNDRVYLLRG